MEKSTAPRARFIAAILLFAAVVIGDLILSRGYLAQGPATWPVFLLLELVMLALLVIGGILFCNRRGLDSNKKLILGFGFFLVWCVLTVIFFADYKALYLSTLHTEYPSYGAAITCLKLVLVLCGLTALIPVAPAPTGRAYADGLARVPKAEHRAGQNRGCRGPEGPGAAGGAAAQLHEPGGAGGADAKAEAGERTRGGRRIPRKDGGKMICS